MLRTTNIAVGGALMLAANMLGGEVFAAPENNLRIAKAIGEAQARDTLDQIAKCTEAIALRPDNSWAYKERGQLYLKMFLYFGGAGDNLNRALADFNESVRLKPDDDDALASRAMIYGMNHQFSSAIADYTQALRIRGFDASIIRQRAQVQHSAGNFDEAIADYSALLAIDPNDSAALGARAMVFRDKGDIEKANADELALQKARGVRKQPKKNYDLHP